MASKQESDGSHSEEASSHSLESSFVDDQSFSQELPVRPPIDDDDDWGAKKKKKKHTSKPSKSSKLKGDSSGDELSPDKKKKKSKKSKKHKKKPKEQSVSHGDDSFDEDDLDIAQAGRRRLQKMVKDDDSSDNSNLDAGKRAQKPKDNNHQGKVGSKRTKRDADIDQEDGDSFVVNDMGDDDDDDIDEQRNHHRGHRHKSHPNDDEDDSRPYDDISEDDDSSSLHEIMGDEDDGLYGAVQAVDNHEIVDYDLPERRYLVYSAYAKSLNRPLDKVRRDIEQEDRTLEAKWIFERLQTSNQLQAYDDRVYRQKIKGVLDCLHGETLEVMYVFQYRKKVFGDVLTLDQLWRIQELDDEWLSFREQQKKLTDDLQNLVSGFMLLPRDLMDTLEKTTDQKMLQYFKQYTQFTLLKCNYIHSKYRNSIITQMRDAGLLTWLEKRHIFLKPEELCINIKSRVQEKMPTTPATEPQEELELVLRTIDPKELEQKYPLLFKHNRIFTLCRYLEQELFNYPQLRKILKQKYFKRFLISTMPTPKGNSDIGLYSMFYPVKRIKDKPVSTLKREIWVLAQQAEKNGLIKIDLRFEWEMAWNDNQDFQNDIVYREIFKYYFDFSTQKSAELWNAYRKQVLIKMLATRFVPSFKDEMRADLMIEGERQIIAAACARFKAHLMKGPALIEGKTCRILALALENDKLGVTYVDDQGQPHGSIEVSVPNDVELRKFIGQEVLSDFIREYKPHIILVSANCRRAQLLLKEIRFYKSFPQNTYSTFGESQVPSLVARKKKMDGVSDYSTVLQAVSMARLKMDPLAETLTLWDESLERNGILSMNLHPLQRLVNQRKLKDGLEKVAIEVVNLVGVDVNALNKSNHLSSMLPFVCGLGHKKGAELSYKIKQSSQVMSRRELKTMVSGDFVYRNCSPFFKIDTHLHKELLDQLQRTKNYDQIHLLDTTRIPQEWYDITLKTLLSAARTSTLLDAKQKKAYGNLSDQTIALIEVLKRPEKLKAVLWAARRDDVLNFDEDIVKAQLFSRFRSARDRDRVMDNREAFYSLLKETPQSLRRYSVVTVRILSVKKQFLNVTIPENGLFGEIRISQSKPEYQTGNFIKAVIVGFPFDQKRNRDQPEEQQELLKVEMALNFPHFQLRQDDRDKHKCFEMCFPQIVKEIHPLIDLDKLRFEIREQDRPVVEVREETSTKIPRAQMLRITHPKFKNVSTGTAIELVKSEPRGEFIIRPSSQGAQFLTITWHFYNGIVSHIKLKSEQKGNSLIRHTGPSNLNYVYRVLDKDRDKIFNSLEEAIEKHLKPMQALVQDVISSKKFLPIGLQKVQQRLKAEMSKDPVHIHYYFACSEQFPQFFVLIYMYRDKRPIKELIRVRSSGLYFHDQQFQSLRDVITWFKEHLKDKEYQKYVKAFNMTTKL